VVVVATAFTAIFSAGTSTVTVVASAFTVAG
jgi:hypothetical protein